MKAIKFIDTSGNVNYVKGETYYGSLVRASLSDTPYKGETRTMFFRNYSDLQKWLNQNTNKMLIGTGCISTGLRMGYSRNNHVYQITEV